MLSSQADQAKAEADYELFLRDLEEDEELRANVQLFKAAPTKAAPVGDEMDTDGEAGTDDDDDDEDGEMPKINVDELLDDMEGLNIVSLPGERGASRDD